MSKKSNKKLREDALLSLPYHIQHVLRRDSRIGLHDKSKGWEEKLLRDLKDFK